MRGVVRERTRPKTTQETEAWFGNGKQNNHARLVITGIKQLSSDICDDTLRGMGIILRFYWLICPSLHILEHPFYIFIYTRSTRLFFLVSLMQWDILQWTVGQAWCRMFQSKKLDGPAVWRFGVRSPKLCNVGQSLGDQKFTISSSSVLQKAHRAVGPGCLQLSTHQPPLCPRGGLRPVLLMCNP
jgi:hypothetical protein